MIIIADMHICVTKFSLSPKPKRSDRGRPEQSSFPGLSASQFWDLFCQSQQPVALSFQITKYDTAVARSNQMLRSLSRGHNPYQMHSATAREQQKLFPEASAPCFPIDLFLLMLMPKPQVLRLKLELELESKHFQRHNRREA